MAYAISILPRGLGDQLPLVDAKDNYIQGETIDLQHGSPFERMPNFVSSTYYLVTANSSLMIVKADILQQERESCLELVKRN